MRQRIGMTGAHVRLPSGRSLKDVEKLVNATPDEVAYLVARTMFSHAEGDRFLGSIDFAMRLTWDENEPTAAKAASLRKSLAKGVARALHLNGFSGEMDNTKTNGGRFFWRVPPVFPAWQTAATKGEVRVEDDGSQTEGGQVTVRQITRQMRQLMNAVIEDPARHPRDYSKKLGWDVPNVAATLIKYGYIEARGATSSSRYYPVAGKALPIREAKPVPVVKPVVVKAATITATSPILTSPVPVAPIGPDADAIEAATGGTVVFDKHGHMLVLKDGVLYRPEMTWALKPLTGEVS